MKINSTFLKLSKKILIKYLKSSARPKHVDYSISFEHKYNWISSQLLHNVKFYQF